MRASTARLAGLGCAQRLQTRKSSGDTPSEFHQKIVGTDDARTEMRRSFERWRQRGLHGPG
ncbi:hypothetical protein AB0F68_19545 [Micromonospora sp. NPDC023966]|jgi:hypothetical protein|uniref:hypothetical protein n=1 Tax=Micromonospora sp. NPDC023966 TaxID=3154699 RepID=UPI00340FD057